MHFHDDIRVYIHQQFIVVLMGYSHESQDLEAVLWTISFFVLVAHGFCLNPSENWKIVFYVSNRTIWRRQSIQHSPHLLKKIQILLSLQSKSFRSVCPELILCVFPQDKFQFRLTGSVHLSSRTLGTPWNHPKSTHADQGAEQQRLTAPIN